MTDQEKPKFLAPFALNPVTRQVLEWVQNLARMAEKKQESVLGEKVQDLGIVERSRTGSCHASLRRFAGELELVLSWQVSSGEDTETVHAPFTSNGAARLLSHLCRTEELFLQRCRTYDLMSAPGTGSPEPLVRRITWFFTGSREIAGLGMVEQVDRVGPSEKGQVILRVRTSASVRKSRTGYLFVLRAETSGPGGRTAFSAAGRENLRLFCQRAVSGDRPAS